MTTIAITNEKGGVGKTTTTLTLGTALAERGYHVELIGLDPQRDLVDHFSGTMMALLPNLQFTDATARTLKKALQRSKADFILIDCPPTLGREVAAALALSDIALVPVQPEALPVQGLKRMMQTLNAACDPARRGSNPALKWKLLLTRFDATNNDSYAIEERLRASLGEQVWSGIIKQHKAFGSAALEKKSVLQTAPRIHPAGVYRALARDIAKGFCHEQ